MTTAAILLAGLTAYRAGGQPLVERLYAQEGMSFFIVPDQIRERATAVDCYVWGNQFLVGLLAATIGIGIARFVIQRETNGNARRALANRVLNWGFPCVVAATVFVVFQQSCAEAPWYRFDDAMTFRVDPPFRHRVLFVLIARAFQQVLPALSDRQALLASQVLAVFLAIFALQGWCKRVAPARLSYVGLALAGMMLAPTFQYYTSYDFGLVFFYSLCLTLLSQRRYVAYVAAATIGTLNHELIVFMMVLSFGIAHSQGQTWRWAIGFVLIQLALYAAVRGVLFWLMPVDLAWLPGKIWINVDRLVHFEYLRRTVVLMSWFAMAIALGARWAPAQVRWMILLLPMLFAMTLLVGQINEARQFVAFIPIATVLLLARFKDGMIDEGAVEGSLVGSQRLAALVVADVDGRLGE
jgi:hypothetical protein